MRLRSDSDHKHPWMVKGVGRVYVDEATSKLLKWGMIGWAASLLPSAWTASLILPEDSPVFLALIGGISFFGWMFGVVFAAVLSQRSGNDET